jgi:Protein of unknown function (DUF3309)
MLGTILIIILILALIGALPRWRSARSLHEPDGQAASISQRCVIVPSVRHAMPLKGNVMPAFKMKLERHDRSEEWTKPVHPSLRSTGPPFPILR